MRTDTLLDMSDAHIGPGDDGWMLGGFVNKDGVFRFVDVRPVDAEERQRITEAIGRLSNASGHTLIGGLVSSLNEFLRFVTDIESAPNDVVSSSEFRRKFNSRLSAWLTSFSGFRAELEQFVEQFPLPVPSLVPENFGNMYKQHPSFRLTWQLRNLDQHHPPVGSRLKITSELDRHTDKPVLRVTVNPLELCAAEIRRDERSKQWVECRDLWADQLGVVDIRWVFKEALTACNVVVASYVSEREYLLIQDINLLGKLYAEAVEAGSPSIYRRERSADRSLLNIEHHTINPLIFGEAIVTIDGARKVLGREPIDWDSDPRIG